VFYAFFNLGINNFVEVNTVLFFKICCKIFHRNFVSRFKFAVFFIAVLNSIVGEMHVSIFKVEQIELIAARPYVAFFEEVSTEMHAVDNLSDSKHPDIKLSHWRVVPVRSTNQNRVMNVSLHDPLFIWLLLKELCDGLNFLEDSDSSASI